MVEEWSLQRSPTYTQADGRGECYRQSECPKIRGQKRKYPILNISETIRKKVKKIEN